MRNVTLFFCLIGLLSPFLACKTGVGSNDQNAKGWWPGDEKEKKPLPLERIECALVVASATNSHDYQPRRTDPLTLTLKRDMNDKSGHKFMLLKNAGMVKGADLLICPEYYSDSDKSAFVCKAEKENAQVSPPEDGEPEVMNLDYFEITPWEVNRSIFYVNAFDFYTMKTSHTQAQRNFDLDYDNDQDNNAHLFKCEATLSSSADFK